MTADDSLPDDIEILKELVRRRDAELALARAEASNARAEASSAEALITHLRLRAVKAVLSVIEVCELCDYS